MTVAADVTVAEVVGQNNDHVRFFSRRTIENRCNRKQNYHEELPRETEIHGWIEVHWGASEKTKIKASARVNCRIYEYTKEQLHDDLAAHDLGVYGSISRTFDLFP
jgi:hypothetical protein